MHKYNAKKTVVDGITFDSKKEAKFYVTLKKLKEDGFVTEFVMQPVYILQEGYKRGKRSIQPITYKADFLVTYADGTIQIVDCKGVKTEVYRIKKKIFEYRYPDLEIVEV